MRLRLFVLVLCAGCSPEKVASSENLVGLWRPTDGEPTVFSFVAASDGEEYFSLSANQIEPQVKPLSGVYVSGQLTQIATYEATPSELLQTVLVDANNAPGAKFSTRIYEFERDRRMVLESKKTGGPREWGWYDFCPLTGPLGTRQIAATPEVNALTTGGSAAFDAQGRLYAYTGSGLPNEPGFLEVGRGCGAKVFSTPNGKVSSTHVHRDGFVRIAYQHIDGSLRVREKRVGTEQFAETTLLPAVRTRPLQLLDHGDTPALFVDDQLFSKQGDVWAPGTLKPRTNGTPMPLTGKWVSDANGRLWVLNNDTLLREGESAFEVETLPPNAQPLFDLYVDPELNPHVLSQTKYCARRDQTWTCRTYDSSPATKIVTHGTQPWRVLTITGNGQTFDGEPVPWLSPALVVIHEDGKLESWLAGGPQNLLSLNTTWAAVGPRGEVAASLTGEAAVVWGPRGPLFASPSKLEIQVTGPPVKIISRDGKHSCDGSCMLDVQLGERIAFDVVKQPGVAATLQTCDRRSRAAKDPCWVSAMPRQNAATVETFAVLKVLTRVTPIDEAVSASNAQSITTTFGLNADWVAAAVLHTGTAREALLDGVVIPVTGVFESVSLVMLNRSTGQTLSKAIPPGLTVTQVTPDGQGGLWAGVIAQQAITLDGQTLGVQGSNVLSVIHLAGNGSVDRSVRLGSVGVTVAFVGPSVGKDGSAAAVFSSTGALSALGVTQNSALVRVAADGARTVNGFVASALPNGGRLQVQNVEQMTFALNDGRPGTTVYAWNQGRLVSTQLAELTVRDVFTSPGGGALVAATSSVTQLTISGRTLNGQTHLLSFDANATLNDAFSTPTPSTNPLSLGVAQVNAGIAFIANGTLQWLSPTLTPLRPEVPLPSTAGRISGVGQLPLVAEGDAVWFLGRPDADFNGVTGATAIGKLLF